MRADSRELSPSDILLSVPPRETSGPPAVSCKAVSKVYPGARPVIALDGVDLEIASGEFLAVVGPSGGGKSTLLHLLGGIDRPTSGEVRVGGRDIGSLSEEDLTLYRRREAGLVFQFFNLLPHITVRENVELPRALDGLSDAALRAGELLDRVGLLHRAGAHPYELSGGEMQRVAIARALSFEPRILLMDEPFGALDEMTRERLNDAVLRIWERTGITIVFVTHSIPEAVYLSSRIVVMSARPGRIAGSVDVDLPRPRTDETRESDRFFGLVTAVREMLRSGGVVPAPDPASGPQETPDRNHLTDRPAG